MFRSLRHSTLHRSVALRLAAGIIVIVAIGMGLLATHTIQSQSSLLRAQITELGHLLGEQLALASVEPLFTDRHYQLNALVARYVENPMVIEAIIRDHQGVALSRAGPKRQPGDGAIAITVPVAYQDAVAGTAHLAISDRPLRAAQRQVLRSSAATATLLCLLLCPLAILLGRRLARPIHTLVDATRLLQRGEYTRIEERRGDEFGDLIQVLNHLGQGLVRRGQVESLIYQVLDREVADKLLAHMEPVRVGGDRVEATVLFADIVGFTALSEQLSPEDVNAFLNEYFRYFNSCARFFFGTVDKFIGDAVMIVFGATRPDPRHRYHAVACALLMQRLAARLNLRRIARGQAPVELRIGINSGEMLAGLVGSDQRLEYTVVGDAVNLASRLCNEAHGGEILIDESLYQELARDHRIDIDPVREIRLRGMRRPIRIVRVLDLGYPYPGVLERLLDDVIGHEQEVAPR